MQLHFDSYDPEQVENIALFQNIMDAYPSLKFFQPSPDRAPWHVQVIFDPPTGEAMALNFWPHRMKAQRWTGGKAEEGHGAVVSAIEEAIDDLATLHADRDAFSLIED